MWGRGSGPSWAGAWGVRFPRWRGRRGPRGPLGTGLLDLLGRVHFPKLKLCFASKWLLVNTMFQGSVPSGAWPPSPAPGREKAERTQVKEQDRLCQAGRALGCTGHPYTPAGRPGPGRRAGTAMPLVAWPARPASPGTYGCHCLPCSGGPDFAPSSVPPLTSPTPTLPLGVSLV